MKKFAIITLSIFLCASYGCEKKERAAIKIGTIEITAGEFDEGFRQSNLFHAKNKEEGRQEFLDNLIRRKLILKEAEIEGVNKDPSFLKSIQLFWEQSLLKLMLDKKTRELFAGVKVSDEEIRDFYELHKDQDFANKELPKVYDAIKILLLREKEITALQGWVDSLKEKTNIEIDYPRLGIRQK